MYYKKTWVAGAAVAVHNSYAPRMGRAALKDEKKAASRPAVQRYNDKIRKRKLTNVVNANFLPGDGHLVLGISKGLFLSADEAMKLRDKFFREMRTEAKKAGVAFKYIHAMAVGERGALHHHLIVNREVIALARLCWPYGSVNVGFLYDNRNYQKLAKYFCGQDKGENSEDPRAIRIYGNKYSTSRNLIRPEAEVEALDAVEWEKYPEAIEGHIIDPASIDIGENPVNGKPYQYYIMLPVQVPRGLVGKKKEDWIEKERVKNAAEVRWLIDRLSLELEAKRLKWDSRDSAV